MSTDSLPRHVAIIMDGNGRWAQERGLERLAGHREGARSVRKIVTHAREIGIRYLTLYAFSSENWGRPGSEISGLMDLLAEYLVEEKETLLKNDIELSTIGVTDSLPVPVRHLLNGVCKETKGLDGMRLTLALSYGGRDELLRAIRKVATRVDRGELDPEEIRENDLTAALDTHDLPDPDLLIRTSGEQRLSNFLLWQLAYAELWFTPTAWPDFTTANFDEAVQSYTGRQRRFGLTGAQVQTSGAAKPQVE